MEELILLAQAGNEDAFIEMVMQIKNDLYKIAKSRLSNEADIDDAIQETMLETYKSIKKLNNPNKFKKWIIKILINKCNRIYRKKYKNDISLDEYNFDNKIKNILKKEINEPNSYNYTIKIFLIIKKKKIIIIHFLELLQALHV